MNKFLIYTSNLKQMPKSMSDVIRFAKENHKCMIANVELNAQLANVREGDNIISKKGNSIFVLRTISTSREDWSAEDQEFVDTWTRQYGLKKVNITGVSHVIKFETWCKSAQTLVNNNDKSTKTTKEMGTNSFKNLSARLKDRFMPTEAKDVRIAQDGNICVLTNDGYVAITAENELVAYPEEFTFALPVFIMSKPAAQLVEGDVIAKNNRYYKITKITDGKISTLGYNGVGHTVKTVSDFILGAAERVVVSLAGNLGGGTINPMMLYLMNKEDKGGSSFKDLLPLMMLNQQGGQVGFNPMMLALMGDGADLKDFAMMSMLGGGNLFGGAAAGANPFANLFGAAPVAPAAAAPAAAPAKPARPRVAKKAAKKEAPAQAAE